MWHVVCSESQMGGTVKSCTVFAGVRALWCDAQMSTISRSTMDEVIEANKYLQLPRLSSQLFFNQLCPPSSDARNRRQVLAPYIHCIVDLICHCIICAKKPEAFWDYTTVEPCWNGYEIPAKLSRGLVCRLFIQKSLQNTTEFLQAVDVVILHFCSLLKLAQHCSTVISYVCLSLWKQCWVIILVKWHYMKYRVDL